MQCTCANRLGNPTNPLLPWLMKQYPDIRDPGTKEFNFKLISCSMVVECMFGRLKSHWYCLPAYLDASVANAVHMTMACCAVHNICEGRDQYFCLEWAQDTLVCKPCAGNWILHTCTLLCPKGQGRLGCHMCTHPGSTGRDRMTSALCYCLGASFTAFM